MATNAQAKVPETKRKLLDAAVQLMLHHGFSATTVDEICATAGLTKGSFFHYFKSKDELGEAALDHYCAAQRTQFEQNGFHKIADPLERLDGLLDCIAKKVQLPNATQGCLIGNLTQEISHTHPRMRAQCEANFSGLITAITATLTEAKQKYPPKTDFDPNSVATLFVSLLQGSLLLVKAQQQASPLLDNLQHFRAYVASLFGHPGRH